MLPSSTTDSGLAATAWPPGEDRSRLLGGSPEPQRRLPILTGQAIRRAIRAVSPARAAFPANPRGRVKTVGRRIAVRARVDPLIT
jgi:hypothetical protein